MKLLQVGWILAFVLAVITYPAAWIMARQATEVWMLSPAYDEGQVELNRDLDAPDPKDPEYAKKVIQMYGLPASEPKKVLFVPKEKFIHPKEIPSLTLLPVDKDKKENPLQVQTVWFFAKWVTGGFGVVFAMMAGPWFFLRSRKKRVPA